MSQFRRDPFGAGWVIISPERGLQASDFGSAHSQSARCALCPGSEAELGGEIRASRPSASASLSPEWRYRVVSSPQASLRPDRAFSLSEHALGSSATSYGYQELIVEHPQHGLLMNEMPAEHVVELFKLYRERLAFLAQKPAIKHVQLSRSVGRQAGAAYEHPHAQVLAIPVGNRWIDEERAAAQAYFRARERCLFCDVVANELKDKERLVSSNDSFVAVTPYASRTPFELWILPRSHSACFPGLASNHLAPLVSLLQAVLKAMNRALNTPPHNMLLHTLITEDASYHWHLEILPRLTAQAGFDWSSGFYVNPTPPEDAARFLREALAMEMEGVGL